MKDGIYFVENYLSFRLYLWYVKQYKNSRNIFLYFSYIYCIIYLYFRKVNKVELLGCTTTLVILNLHFFSWETNIYKRMSGRQWLEGRFLCEVAHLAWLGLKMQETALPVVLLKNREIPRIDKIPKILHSYKRRMKQHWTTESICLCLMAASCISVWDNRYISTNVTFDKIYQLLAEAGSAGRCEYYIHVRKRMLHKMGDRKDRVRWKRKNRLRKREHGYGFFFFFWWYLVLQVEF